MLLSPAGLRVASHSPTMMAGSSGSSASTSTASSMFVDARGRKTLQVPGARTEGGRGMARPPIKRTASTASINEMGELNLPPSLQARDRGDDETSVSRERDEDMDMGTLEDWEPEDEEDEGHDEAEGLDPFSAGPSVRRATATNRAGPSHPSSSSSSSMMLEPSSSPSSSPTAHASSRRSKPKSRILDMAGQGSDEDIADNDEDDDNPFLAKPSAMPRAPRKRAADSRPKVSYVFRGKRITYDAPLESLFPHDSDEDLPVIPGMKSGPRVLFPSPPEPAKSKPKPSEVPCTPRARPGHAAHSPPPTASSHPTFSKVRSIELMQTPRRQPTPAAAALAADAPQNDVQVQAALERKRKDPQPERRAIPPTPASLPQKTKEQRQLERERFMGAMRGIQNAPAQSSNAERIRRYAPYPPR